MIYIVKARGADFYLNVGKKQYTRELFHATQFDSYQGAARHADPELEQVVTLSVPGTGPQLPQF